VSNKLKKKITKLLFVGTVLMMLLPLNAYGEQPPEDGPYVKEVYWKEVDGSRTLLHTINENKYTYEIPLNFEYMKKLRQSSKMDHLFLETTSGSSGFGGDIESLTNTVNNNTGGTAHILHYVLDRDNEARLAELMINNERLPDFEKDTYQDGSDDLGVNSYEYNYEISFGKNIDLKAITVDKQATMEINEFGAIPTTILIGVTSEDESVKKEYQIYVDYKKNNTLHNITVDGKKVIDFTYEKGEYNVELPYGFDKKVSEQLGALEATAAGAYADSGFVLSYDSSANVEVGYPLSFPNKMMVRINDETYINVLREYTINLTIAKNTEASLNSLMMEGIPVEGFTSDTLSYTKELAYGTTAVPNISAVAKDSNANVQITPATALPGTTQIEVTAEDGTTIKTYTVEFTIAKNTEASLSSLMIEGIPVEGFTSDTLSYTKELAYGTTTVPNISAVAKDSNANVQITPATALPGTTQILVTAEDGISSKTYSMNFTVRTYTYYSEPEEPIEPKPEPKPEPKDENTKKDTFDISVFQESTLNQEEKVEKAKEFIQGIVVNKEAIKDEKKAEEVVEEVNARLEDLSLILNNIEMENKPILVSEVVQVAEDIQYAIEEMKGTQEQVDQTMTTIHHMGEILEEVQWEEPTTEQLKEKIVDMGEKILEKVGKIGIRENILLKSHKLSDAELNALQYKFFYFKKNLELAEKNASITEEATY